MDRIVPPILVWEPGDLGCYASKSEAESALEAIDVEAGAYIAFDAEGRQLNLSIALEKRRSFGVFTTEIPIVRIESAEEEPTHQSELRNILLQFLEACGADLELLSATSLSDLVQAASDRSQKLSARK